MFRKLFHVFIILTMLVQFWPYSLTAEAASPAAPYFELCVSPTSGGDCSGDGDGVLNKFYVGQTFDAKIMINTGGSNTKSANVIINYDPSYLLVNDAKVGVAGTQIQAGSLYENYPDNGNSASGGVIKLTGANVSGSDYNGAGIFGTISFTVVAQKPEPLDTTIDFTPGSTIDSNIVRSGDSADILASVEDSQWELLPDIGKPYVNNVNYDDGSTNVPVESNITFHILDDETGVNTSSVNVIISENGGDSTNRNAWVSASCSGSWGTNDCLMTINPADIGNRNWNYNSTYAVIVQDGADRASVDQSPAGPNVMDPYSFSFTTEGDLDAPIVASHAPTGNAESVTSNITFRISDVKTSVPTLGTYGTGVDPSSIMVDVTTLSGLTTYQCSDSQMTCSAVINSGLTWAYDVVIDPSDDFAQNDQILVSVRDATDLATPPNTMSIYNWSFWTQDQTGPLVDRWDPAKGANNITPNSKISFHVSDSGVGVDISTLQVAIGEDVYSLLGDNTFEYSGDASDYLISITPVSQFTGDKPVPISINVADNSSNKLTPEDLYAVVYDVDPEAPTCPVCDVCGDSGETNDGDPKEEVKPTTTVVVTPSNECPAAGTVTPEEVICEIPNVPADDVLNKLSEDPQSITSMRNKLNEIDRAFKAQIEKDTFVLKIDGHKVKNPDSTLFLWSAKSITVSGTTTPHANVSVITYSKPVTETAYSDSQGNWQATYTNVLSSGSHMLFLNIVKDQAESGYLAGAKIYIIPIWLKILFLAFLVLILCLGGYLLWSRKNKVIRR